MEWTFSNKCTEGGPQGPEESPQHWPLPCHIQLPKHMAVLALKIIPLALGFDPDGKGFSLTGKERLESLTLFPVHSCLLRMPCLKAMKYLFELTLFVMF